jgi:hypothetical protein
MGGLDGLDSHIHRQRHPSAADATALCSDSPISAAVYISFCAGIPRGFAKNHRTREAGALCGLTCALQGNKILVISPDQMVAVEHLNEPVTLFCKEQKPAPVL